MLGPGPHLIVRPFLCINTKHNYVGTFRIGRGQLFAFGVNTWHTNNIRLGVDVNGRNSLEFDYDEIEQVHKGCYVNVDLYDVLSGRELAECIRETEQVCGCRAHYQR